MTEGSRTYRLHDEYMQIYVENVFKTLRMISLKPYKCCSDIYKEGK